MLRSVGSKVDVSCTRRRDGRWDLRRRAMQQDCLLLAFML